MINVDVRVLGDEVLLRLDKLPQSIRNQIKAKFGQIFGRVESELQQNVPGKFIDPKYIQTGVDEQGSLLIGWLEIEDKPGVYAIYPTKARILRFLSREGKVMFARQVLNHPFLKGAPVAERYLIESKPWVVGEINAAVLEAINGR